MLRAALFRLAFVSGLLIVAVATAISLLLFFETRFAFFLFFFAVGH